jgi:hypothetical protein
MNINKSIPSVLIGLLVVAICVNSASAIPAFSRKYETSCSTCHYAYPKLNAFGKAFQNNGLRYPEGQDPEMTKEEPVSLGAESYKRVWPDAIWPTDMAGTSPLAIHMFGRVHYGGSWDDPTTTDEVEEDKAVYFEIPHEFELLFGGTFSDKISYFGEVELEHESELAYEFAVNYDFSPSLHLKLGSVGLTVSPEHHRLTREHYNTENLKNQSGTWRMRNGAGGGVELWGAGNGSGGRGGFTYALGVGNGQNDEDNFDLNTAKDFYARGTYKIGGLGEIGGTEGQASETSAFYVDNSVRVGGFFYSGNAVADTLEDKFSVVGGDIDLWYERLNIVALFMSMSSDYSDVDRSSIAYFVEGQYVLYPWLIGEVRYEFTDADTDDDTADPATNLIPGIIIMARANVKCSLEYLIPLDEARKEGDRFTLQFNVAF